MQKNSKKNILYYLIFGWFYLHALLPLGILYVLSDMLYFLVYKLVGYRLKVVKENLRNSFPDKSESERKKIEKGFYHFFCDYVVETIKLLHISDAEMSRRMKFENLDLIKELTKEGNSVLMLLGHYGNWEFIPSIVLHLKEIEGLRCGQIYRPLKNKAFDELFLKIRSRFKTDNIAKNNTLRSIVNYKRQNTKILIGFMADQTPSVNNIYYWSDFLHQDTPLFTGVERIAHQTGFSVIYLDIQRIKRGYYKASPQLITDQPSNEKEFEITEKYIRMFEQTIIADPTCWLWTHKRWKIKR